ncbi:hypothetical protein EKH57_08905 [Halorubrum sp. BOL3-1]|uniref:bifunctional DNA primase/polymerase n=1 Tax=Halorubrum sp. BOL3-1 TaxID=2497325 RepID=UPI001004E4FA|nr:bifunctional DNA primase/polymerase [Halorubrum sp. BOL3-1]QAU12836.1 hypothetical protein EKH57_08905 [Halorubrum sp. BOL3-1]
MGKPNPSRDDGGEDRTSEHRQVVAERLKEVGLRVSRFIDVKDGRKQSYTHTLGGPTSVNGNYGVYTGDGLVGVDVDDYKTGVDTTAVDELPATFTVATPHDGEHRYYRVEGDAASKIRAITGGAANISLEWGEIHTDGKYLVGPSSEITRCSKSWCVACEAVGRSYAIEKDRPIATITAEQLGEVILADDAFESAETNQQRLVDF